MKKRMLFPFLAIICLLFSSCEDLLDVKETFTFEHEFHVTSGQTIIQEFVSVDMTLEQSLIADYGSKIKKIEIESARYWISSNNGPANQTITSLTLQAGNTDGSDMKNLASVQNVVLSTLLSNPTNLPIEAQGIEKLASRIKSAPHSFSLSMNGNVNEAPMDFRVVFEFKIKMTANPL